MPRPTAGLFLLKTLHFFHKKYFRYLDIGFCTEMGNVAKSPQKQRTLY